MKKNDDTTEAAGARPTLKTIAEISGLAVATVSRALSDAPDLSTETKRKVAKIAAEIGYVPNRAGVRLRTGRTHVISLILETEHDSMNMTARLIGSIARGLSGTPYHLVMTPEMPGQDPLQAVKYVVETRSADAIIINRIQPEDPRVAYLTERKFPFVTHGRSNWARTHAYFDFDNDAFGRIAVKTLAKRGRKHILLLAPPREQSYAREMIEGARRTANEFGVSLEIARDISSDSDREQLSRGITQYFDRFQDLDALISASPNATLVATQSVENAGHGIGKDFDIFSKDTVLFLKSFRPEILTIEEDVEKAGKFLAKAAIHEVDRKGRDHMQQLDEPADPA